jgi:iron complex transport system permease protein
VGVPRGLVVKSRPLYLAALAVLALGTCVAALLIGYLPVDWAAAWRGEGADGQILWRVRLPRVCLGFLAGASLSVSGMAFQALFRNPLATPFTLGVSSGASLGAALYVKAGFSAGFLGLPGQSIAALLGAGLSIGLVYGFTRAGRGFSTATLLLAGVAVSFFFSSLILFVQYIGDLTTSFRISRWLMGGLEIVGFEAVRQTLPFAGFGLAAVLVLSRELDLFSVGEDLAAARGVSVPAVKKFLFFAASLMVGGVVAVCGPIGFVGLIVPHIGRLLVGPRHRELAPFALFAGGAFLVACDTLGRRLIAPTEIPVGIITSLIGGPFFLVLLVRGYSDS